MRFRCDGIAGKEGVREYIIRIDSLHVGHAQLCREGEGVLKNPCVGVAVCYCYETEWLVDDNTARKICIVVLRTTHRANNDTP